MEPPISSIVSRVKLIIGVPPIVETINTLDSIESRLFLLFRFSEFVPYVFVVS